ncbi:MAG: trypsin-like peptidase domain-containing protein [Acidobacteriota bacterium]|nr:trypsin-like peptidase domain-containing protein [Acidobacteriota bacterium]
MGLDYPQSDDIRRRHTVMREHAPARFFVFALLVALLLYAGLLWRSGVELPKAEPGPTEPTEDASNAAATPDVAPRGALQAAEQATVDLFREASPSVVYITTVDVRRDYFTMSDYAVPSGAGSGFVWDDQGHIVTNYHVIQGADRAHVTLGDQSSWPATLVGVAREKDLAVLKIEAPANQVAALPVGSSSDLLVGQSVFAIGNPFGLDHTLTTGVISALGREIQSLDPQRTRIEDVIQTDAAINPGNSGGPLLDSFGRLVGVNTQIYSPSGASAGIGFAIPVDTVRWVVPDLIEHGEIHRPALGIYPGPDTTAKRAGIEGVIFVRVEPDGPADRAGLQPLRRDRRGRVLLGDIITAIDGEPVRSREDLTLLLERKEEGDRVEVTYLRGRDERKAEVRLEVPDSD